MNNSNKLIGQIESIQARVRSLAAEITALAETLPEDDVPQDNRPEAILAAIRDELHEAATYISNSLDFLTPRSDDDSPECCAHRKLRELAEREAA
jgi:hypothetical protein